MKITGTITVVLPETNGVSKSGKNWRKKEAVVQYEAGQYPKSIVFQMMGDKIDKLNIQQGLQYELDIDFDAREWNGRWFLQATCWGASALNQPQQPYQQAPQQYPPQQGYPQQGYAPSQQAPQAQSGTPTLDSLGVQGFRGQFAQPPAQAQGEDDLPF